MKKAELLFYSAYEDFYEMADKSKIFREFCKEAFGEDFSQDGFSDVEEINQVSKYIPKKEDVHILDIGCGNGKMLAYLREKTGVYIHGFDYSEKAIDAAKKLYEKDADFSVGIIGEIEYPSEQFDLIVSMDSMYFAPDMVKFIGQVKQWLKKDGILFVGYQEGDVVPKSKDAHTTLLAKALRANRMKYQVNDVTGHSYEVLVKKREAAIKYKEDFLREGFGNWYDLLMLQTDYIVDGFEEYSKNLSRYLYIVYK